MAEFEDDINRIGDLVSKKIWCEQHAFYSFHQFAVGSVVTLDLVREQVDGVAMESDQTIIGTLRNNKLAVMAVTAATLQPDLVGRDIGLAMNRYIATPTNFVAYLTLPYCIAPHQTVAYYFPEEIPLDAPHGTPTEFHQIAARYGRVVVGDVEYFDVR